MHVPGYPYFYSLKIDNNNLAQVVENNERARRLREQGMRPMEWSQFEQQDSVVPKRSMYNGLLGVGLGWVVGGLVGAACFIVNPGTVSFLVLPGLGLLSAAIGGFIGSSIPHASEVRKQKIQHYDEYLSKLEYAKSRTPQIPMEQDVTASHAERLGRETTDLTLGR